MSFPLLFLLLLPLGGSLFLSFIGNDERGIQAHRVGLWCSGGTLLLVAAIALLFDREGGLQFKEVYSLVPSLDIVCTFGIDGLSLPLIILTAVLSFVCLLVGWKDVFPNKRLYVACILVGEAFLLGVFLSCNLLFFYLFFEASLLPFFFLMGMWGGKERMEAAFQFFLVMVFGSFLLFLSIMILFHYQGTFDWVLLLKKSLPFKVEKIVFGLMLLGFAVKMPLWPFHSWLPKAHGEAPTAASMLLAGVVLKMAGYGLLRYGLPLFPHAVAFFAPFVFLSGAVGLIILSLVTFMQSDIKRFVAYNSVTHMIVMVMGIFTGTIHGMGGALYHMISHGVTSAALFLGVGVLYRRYETYNISFYGGLWKKMPLWSWLFFLSGLSAIGFPMTGGFVGEFLVLLGLLETSRFFALVVGAALFLSVCSFGLLWSRLLFGTSMMEKTKPQTPSESRDCSILGGLVVILLVLGLCPMVLVNVWEKPLVFLEKTLNQEKEKTEI